MILFLNLLIVEFDGTIYFQLVKKENEIALSERSNRLQLPPFIDKLICLTSRNSLPDRGKIFYRYMVHLKKTGVILFAIALLLSISCSVKKPGLVKQSFKKGKHTVRIIEKNSANLYLSKKRLDHPHPFTNSEIFNKLLSLKYKRLTLFSREENVFERKIAEEISPLLTRAFKRASKNDFIEIDARSSRGRISGDVFILRGKLNWRFKIINSASFERRNSRDYLDGWKLVLLKGQKYYGEKELLGVRAAKNWIIYPVDKTWSNAVLRSESDKKQGAENRSSRKESKTPAKDRPGNESSPGQKEIEARFQSLKNLQQKGLITEEEYEMKKKELLEKYF